MLGLLLGLVLVLGLVVLVVLVVVLVPPLPPPPPLLLLLLVQSAAAGDDGIGGVPFNLTFGLSAGTPAGNRQPTQACR